MNEPQHLPGALVRVRHGRTAIGLPLTLGSALAGLGGALSDALRSGAVEASFDDDLAIGWYLVLFLGAILLCYAMTSPCWQDPDDTQNANASIGRKKWLRVTAPFSRPWCELVTNDNYPRIVLRLYAEQIGLYLTGWQWTSYGIAAFYRQGFGGYTAAMAAAVVIGLYTLLRLIELHDDTKGLRAWRDRTRTRASMED